MNKTRWILHNMVGAGLAMGLVSVVHSTDHVHAGLLFVICGAMAGFVVGLTQALALRGIIICGACWVLATALGAAIFTGGVLVLSPGGAIGQIALAIFGGLLIGALQWNSTNRRLPTGWILRTALPFGIAVILPEPHTLGGVLIGGLWGAITLDLLERRL